MKTILSILFVFSYLGIQAQELPFLQQHQVDSCFWQTNFGFYDQLSPLTYLQFASPKNGLDISFHVKPNSKEIEKAIHISWKEPAKTNWVTQKDVDQLLPLIMSSQPCLPAVLMYSSNSCQQLSTVGKEACQILLASKEIPYPNRCSVITDSEWDKMIALVYEKFGKP